MKVLPDLKATASLLRRIGDRVHRRVAILTSRPIAATAAISECGGKAAALDGLRHSDAPAAIPLAALIAGLAVAPALINTRTCVGALVAVALLSFVSSFSTRRTRIAVAALFAALGIVLSIRMRAHDAAGSAALSRIDPDRFVTIEAPLDRDWMPLDDDVYTLRVSSFTADGVRFDMPLAIYARFEPPGFSMERTVRAEGWLRESERGGCSLSVKSPLLLAYSGRLAWYDPMRWNRALARRLERGGTSHPVEVALAEALALGRGERLTTDVRRSFREGGTYHLLVFSGLQIALAAGILAALLRWLHAPRASDWLLLGFAAFAPLFIGPTASVSRASIGIALYALSRILRRPTSIENLWCLAALLRLAVAPHDLTDPAFHLTYAGAGALIFAGKHLGSRRWLGHVVAAETVITPLTLFHFHQYALGGALVTAAMAPLVFAMLVVSLAACALPCEALFAAIHVLHVACNLLNLFGFWGVFTAPPAATLAAAAFVCLIALALLTGRRRAIVLLLAMLIPSAGSVARWWHGHSVAAPEVTFLDVGQGDTVLLRDGTHTVLVDGGPSERVVEQLVDRGVTHVDTIFLTHAHPDHCGGLPAVIEQLGAGDVRVSPRRFRGDCAARMLEACSAAAAPIHLVRDGESLQIASLQMTASLAGFTFRRAAENNSSIVLRVLAGGRRFLLTGDIEREAELALEDRDLSADVLKVAHHGSRSSTSPALLDLVRPRLAVISCGRHNLFGHPHAAVLDALSSRRIRTWRTDTDGSVTISVSAGKLYARSQKVYSD